MTNNRLADDLRSVAAGLLTPFDERSTDEIRYRELESNAKWLYDEGLDLFLAGANISEYHSLSPAERVESARVAREALPADATILGGVGGSTKAAIDLAKAHEANGIDGLMLMPPDHAFKHERGVVEYYRRIADEVDVGLLPYVRGFDVTPRLLKGICALDRVVGIKWALGDVTRFAECVAAVDNDVVWMCGMGEPPVPAYFAEGAEGFSAGVTNFAPRLGIEMFEALERGEWNRVRELRNLTVPLMNLRGERGPDNIYDDAISVPVVKAGLEFAGQYGGPVREPLVELSDHDWERARERYDTLQTEFDRLRMS